MAGLDKVGSVLFRRSLGMPGTLDPNQFSALEEKLGYTFSDRALLELALTHPTAVQDGLAKEDYERLEFLGDRVLGLVASQMLFEQFPQSTEGGLAKRLNALVSRATCAEVAAELEIAPFIIMGSSEKLGGGKRKSAILANVCEAIIAAIYLDGGLKAVFGFFKAHWGGRLATLTTAPLDPKTALQEWAQGQRLALPKYRTVERTGPDHRPHFVVEVAVDGYAPQEGEGLSKKAAEHEAAEQFLVRENVSVARMQEARR